MRWLKLAVEELYDVVNARQGNRFPRVVKSDLWLHGSRFLHLPNAKVRDGWPSSNSRIAKQRCGPAIRSTES
jgi:hypothetical protein